MRNEENVCQYYTEATYDNYFIVKCLLKSNIARALLVTYCIELAQYNYKHVEAKTASTNITWLYSFLYILIQIFCTLFICFVFSVPTDVINLCGKVRIRKSRHYGGQAM